MTVTIVDDNKQEDSAKVRNLTNIEIRKYKQQANASNINKSQLSIQSESIKIPCESE